MRDSIRLSFRLTRLGKRLIYLYAGIYLVELVCQHWLSLPVAEWLSLYPPLSPGFHVWQAATHAFIFDPYSPLSPVFSLIGFVFFAEPIERFFGTRRFLIFYFSAAAAAAAFGMLLSGVEAFSVPFCGIGPEVLALITAFGFLYPDLVIYLFFIIPVRAIWISYITIGAAVLLFLGKADPWGAYHLGGILTALFWVKGGRRLLSRDTWTLWWLRLRYRVRRRRFTVINGGKDKPPTLH
ncbi:MAG: rhomboid family intramembrane serine protease [Thermodesulfobacteriota bacterium]